MVDSRIGEKRAVYTSILHQSKSAIGEPIVRVDRDNDDKDETYDKAIVTRKDAKSEWTPVKDINALKDFLSKAKTDDKRDNMGVWGDRRQFLLFGPRDGKVQNSEVKTMMEFWPGPAQLTSRDFEMNSEHHAEGAWGTYYTRVDPGQTTIDSSSGKDLFTEPVVVTDSYTSRVVEWYADGVEPKTDNNEYHLFH